MVDLKELKALIKYLRKEGVTEFRSGDLEFKLGPKEKSTYRSTLKREKSIQDPAADVIESSYPTQEELLFYSAGGVINGDT